MTSICEILIGSEGKIKNVWRRRDEEPNPNPNPNALTLTLMP